METYTCYVIGNNEITFECAKLLNEFGHQISGIFTQHNEILQWASVENIDVFPLSDLVTYGKSTKVVDYIFHIIDIETSDIIRTIPNKSYITYKMPFYLDLSSSYQYHSMMQGCKHKGYWQVYDTKSQKTSLAYPFDIILNQDETVETFLNKCNAGAIESFQDLIVQLSREDDGFNLQTMNYHSEMKLDQDLRIKLKNFCKVHQVSIQSVLQALTIIFVNQLNSTNHSCITFKDGKVDNILSELLSSSYSGNQIIRLPIHDHTTKSFIKEVDTLNLSLNNLNITFKAWLEFNSEEANVLFYPTNHENKSIFHGICKSNLQITFDIQGNEILLTVQCDYTLSNLYHVGSINKNLMTLLENMLAFPDEILQSVNMVCNDERKLLDQWTIPDDINTKYQTTIHNYFENIATDNELSIAIILEENKLTYSELNKKANQLSHYIKNKYHEIYHQTLQPNTLIGICLERSIDLIISILAVLKSGAAYVPLDPSNPKDRINYIINDSQVSLLITQAHLNNNFNMMLNKTIVIDEVAKDISHQNVNNPIKSSKYTDLAYIIYTSGSTGQPKGVMVPHQGAVNMVLWTIENYPINRNDSVIQIASIAFDFSVWEIFSALLSGAKLILTLPDFYKDPNYLLDTMIKNQITVLGGVPSLFKALFSSDKIHQFKSLKQAVCGAEPLTQELCKTLFSMFNTKLYHGYGPTETSITSTHWTCIKRNYYRCIPIGRPLSNTYLYVLNHDKHVPIGVAGELYIGGIGVALGYLNRDELTKERFICNPFDEPNAPILYKTGDLVRWLPDGNIEFIGRADHQIKLRGFRIELEEVEHALKKFIGIYDCVAVIRNMNDMSHLVAYYTVRNNGENIRNHLRSNISNILPYYMIPSYFVELDALPLTESGKVDRKILPIPNQNNGVIAEEYVAANTYQEHIIASIFSEILKLNKVGMFDNFFSLGGNSLNATQTVSRINEALGLNCNVVDLFKYPTITEFVRYIEKDLIIIDSNNIINLVERNIDQPLSFAQQRLWFMYQYENQKSATYNIPIAYDLKGTLDVNALEISFNILIERQESLRTIFKNINGIPSQVILPTFSITLDPEVITQNNLNKRLSDESHHYFNLENNPAINLKLFKLDHKHFILLINQHNIITDGWSIGVLLNEINAIYKSIVEKTPYNLPSLEFQYVDYAVWQRSFLSGERLDTQLRFWKTYLHDFTEVNLKTDKPRPQTQNYAGDNYQYTIPRHVTNQLEMIAQKNQATLFMVLLAALNVLLYRYTGNEDIVIGTGISGRNRKDIENILGFFVNTLAIRNILSGNLTFTSFLEKVKRSCLDVYANQDVPFELIVEKLQIEREPDRSPVFQIMFILQDANDNVSLSLPDIHSERYPIVQKVSMFDITINVTHNENGITFDIQYNTDLYFRSTIERFCLHLGTLITEIIQFPEKSLQSYNILTHHEIKTLFSIWNNNKCDFPKDKTLIDLFEERLMSASESTAIVSHSGSLTYYDLQQKINQIACAIRSTIHGISQTSIVAVCLHRDLLLIPSMLGILKSGSAYLPLDPHYPVERLQYMLEHSNAEVILTEVNLLEKISAINHHNRRVICVDQLENVSHDIENYNQPSDLAYVIYTSGSTGQPKGIMVEHKSVVNIVYDFQKRLGFSPSDCLLSITSVSFDIFGLEMFLPLLSNGKIILCPSCVSRDPELLVNSIIEHKPTVIQATPSTWRMIADLLIEKNICNQFDILCGGEALDKTLALKLEKIAKHLFNVYGPAETTIWSTINEVKLGDISIGRGLANNYCFVLDKNQNLLPVGIPGELYIGGTGVARAYLDNNELTQKRFIDNPFYKEFDIEECPRLYKTGDIVYWNCDGKLNYIGRNDDQIKIRGHRIEIDEINEILNSFYAIKNAVVIAKKYNNEDTKIIAYYVSADNRQIDIDELRTYLSIKLPSQMIPTDFIQMRALPLNPNNKIDKKALPDIGNTINTKTLNYIEPTTLLQKHIAEIWKRILNIDRVSIDASFFALGGHSLLIPQIIVALNTQFRTEITIRHFIENLTIEKLAIYIEKTNECNTIEA